MTSRWIETACPAPSAAHEAAARERQSQLTKPPGSLGRLEELATTLAALQATDRPRAAAAPIILFAGDHGVTAQNISAFPAAVTVEMLRNFAFAGQSTRSFDETWEQPWGEYRKIRNHYNELTISFDGSNRRFERVEQQAAYQDGKVVPWLEAR